MSGNRWWHLAWSAGGVRADTAVTAGQAHRPSRCRDADCPRPPCRWYREGREDGYLDGYERGHERGYEQGYDTGFSNGYSAGYSAGQAK